LGPDGPVTLAQKNSNVSPIGKLRHSETASLFGESMLIGTPDEAIAGIEDYVSRTRVTHLVAAMDLPGMDPRKVRRSMELFAKEVMPHFRRKSRNPANAKKAKKK
jgi:alkanesulfonate monooxygenase SsuD/methylene tetrahydromethanopterin reductase-like flavin-dependent oxidoreductase (luciferase family)